MAKSQSNVESQIGYYVPQITATVHATLLDNVINLALEEISERHDFRKLRYGPEDYSASANEYNWSISDLVDASYTEIKHTITLMWLKSSTGEVGKINYLTPDVFLGRYPYVDYASRDTGKPVFYTEINSKYYVNVPLDEAVTLRHYYQRYHPQISGSETILFDPPNIAMMAVVAAAISEINDALPGLDLSPKAQAAMMRKEFWINRLIEYDLKRADPIELGSLERGDWRTFETDPYAWVP